MAFTPAWVQEIREANRQAEELVRRRAEKPMGTPEKCILTPKKLKVQKMGLPLPLIIPDTQAGIERLAREIK